MSDSGKEFLGDNWQQFLEKYEFGTYINGPLTIKDSKITNNNYDELVYYKLDYEIENSECQINGLNKLLQSVKIINGDVTLKNCHELTNLNAFKNIIINVKFLI